MDRFASRMIARGPTFDGDVLTGSIHILDLPDAAAARAFAFDEPAYQLGAYRDVLLRRHRNDLAASMWDATPAREAGLCEGHLVLGLGATGDDTSQIGAVALVATLSADEAREALDADRFSAVEVHRWRFGGRPTD